MADLYSVWLGLAKQREIENRILQIKKRRRRRGGRFLASTLKVQLEKAYQTPLREILEELDDDLVRLEETFLTPVEQFSALPLSAKEVDDTSQPDPIAPANRKNFVLKENLRAFIGTLKRTQNYRLKKLYLTTMPQLQKVLVELILYSSYLFKQIEIYQYSKNYNHKLLFHFTNNGTNNLIRKYHRNIVRIVVEEEAEVEGEGVVKQTL